MSNFWRCIWVAFGTAWSRTCYQLGGWRFFLVPPAAFLCGLLVHWRASFIWDEYLPRPFPGVMDEIFIFTVYTFAGVGLLFVVMLAVNFVVVLWRAQGVANKETSDAREQISRDVFIRLLSASLPRLDEAMKAYKKDKRQGIKILQQWEIKYGRDISRYLEGKDRVFDVLLTNARSRFGGKFPKKIKKLRNWIQNAYDTESSLAR
jgi:hypothetical protein